MERPRIEPIDVALGEVAPEHRAEAARRLREDARFRAEVERLAPVVARLERQPARTWRAPDPPPLVVGGGPPPPRPAPLRRGLVLRPAAALAAAVALLAAGGLAGGLLAPDGGADVPAGARTVALRALDAAPGAHGRAELAPDAARVSVAGLPPAGAGRFYELWLLGDRGRLVSLGTFRVGADGAATVRVPLGVAPEGFAAVDVSVERADGDPGHSGRSVLRGAV